MLWVCNHLRPYYFSEYTNKQRNGNKRKKKNKNGLTKQYCIVYKFNSQHNERDFMIDSYSDIKNNIEVAILLQLSILHLCYSDKNLHFHFYIYLIDRFTVFSPIYYLKMLV